MRYITGMHALNLPCSLDTGGDWHTSAMNWDHIQYGDTDGMLDDWGIEPLVQTSIPQLQGERYVANTLRALVDLLREGRYSCAQGAKNDFICNEKYHREFFEHVAMLQGLPGWGQTYDFMCKEFGKEWWDWTDGK